ncbi:MAG: aminodeoxychorismate synthase component I [Deltaproteobacteria bacterium]|nr:aminodeoxychorismate synthase component I [Deltaproteobacteria bacterium]
MPDISVLNRSGEVFVQDALFRRWLVFRHPCLTVQAERADQVIPCLRQIESAVIGESLHAAGFISYEAAPAFDPALEVRETEGFPLLWFGLYEKPLITEDPPLPVGTYSIGDWTPSIERASYNRAIDRIKACIADGETYQVNFTMRLRSWFHGDPQALFRQLVQAQRADYAAFVDTGRFAVCSASPELFIHLDGNLLTSLPMKGTAARGRWLEEDLAQARWLRRSVKNRAENVMIVDMVRNDMGRIAQVGTVHVPRLFHVEKYPTLWQMTSTVNSHTTAGLCEIMQALFPCASITGAPKPRTMHIIAGLETTPRKVYTGCIGFLAPGRRALFNVAIRTVIVDRDSGAAEYGVGGGIVWDSESRDEYEECRIKAKVLTEERPGFDLLETILWEPDNGFFLLDYHLKRMEDSARYFDFPFDRAAVLRRLYREESMLPRTTCKIRLLLCLDGSLTCQSSPLPGNNPQGLMRLGLATTPVDPANIFLYHKTTYRHLYENARKSRPECDDVLLWNDKGQITESTIANLVIHHGGQWITPPVSCGLLPGTFRARLLDEGKIIENPITMDMLNDAQRLCLVNSVRKWQEACLDPLALFSPPLGKSSGRGR